MNGFERRREQKKTSIIHAAARLFLENGLNKVTMQEIANKANVSYAIIFRIFTSKQNLILEIIKWLYETRQKQLEDMLKGDSSFLDRINQVFYYNSQIIGMNLDIFRDATAIDSEEVARIVTSYEEKTNQAYRDFFGEGKREGYIHSNLSIESLLLYRYAFHALIQLRPEVLTEFKYNQQLFKDFMQILWFGMIVRNDESEALGKMRDDIKSSSTKNIQSKDSKRRKR
jgi:AcrR family transcriptional regulator